MEENKNEKGCCGGNCSCGAMKNKLFQVILAIIAVSAVFAIGFCFGQRENRFEGRDGYGWNKNNEEFEGCPMMRGDNVAPTGCPRLNATGTTTEIK
jgi:hypothetical protein